MSVDANGRIGVEKQMVVNITCDHRVVYGAHAAEFLQASPLLWVAVWFWVSCLLPVGTCGHAAEVLQASLLPSVIGVVVG